MHTFSCMIKLLFVESCEDIKELLQESDKLRSEFSSPWKNPVPTPDRLFNPEHTSHIRPAVRFGAGFA